MSLICRRVLKIGINKSLKTLYFIDLPRRPHEWVFIKFDLRDTLEDVISNVKFCRNRFRGFIL